MAAPEMTPDSVDEASVPPASPRVEPMMVLAASWAASDAIWPKPIVARAESTPPEPPDLAARLSALLIAPVALSRSFSVWRACRLTIESCSATFS